MVLLKLKADFELKKITPNISLYQLASGEELGVGVCFDYFD